VCIDDGTEVAAATLTTPPALEISRTLARMAESGCKAAAMEASSHSLHQHRVGALAIRVGVFTNLTHDHLDYHGTMDAYGAAKAMLFAMLPSAAAAGSAASGGVAIVNQDDPWHARMIEGCKARIVRCGIKARESVATPVADWHATVIKADARTTTIRVRGPWDGAAGIAAGPASDGEGVLTIELPLIGEHNVMNALQAAATAYEMGLSVGALAAGLGRINAPPGRLEPVTAAGAPLTVYVDYAHTDDALERVLLTVRKAMGRTRTSAGAGAELHCVFGCGGDRDRSKRPKMGRVASMLADRVIVTSDNPRSEEPRGIIEQVAAGISSNLRAGVVIEQDRAAAIGAAVASMQAGDVLVIAGKGHEDYQIVSDGQGGTVKNHFDDRHVAATALVKRGVAVVPHFARILTEVGSGVGFGTSAGGLTGAGGKRGGR